MGFTNLPAVDAVIEQVGLLERKFHDQLAPKLAYTGVAERYPIAARGGETLTVSRPALYPLGATSAIVNPATRNTGTDNGLTPQTFGYEQVQLSVQEWALAADVSLEQEQVLVANLVLKTAANLGQNAGATFDQNLAIIAHQAYDSGNTFVTALAASGATSIHVDNGLGFSTAFSTLASSSPGLPANISTSNTIAFNVYNGTTGALKGNGIATGWSADASNQSTAYVGGTAYGVSGTLTLSLLNTAIAAGDQIVAVDGSYILRPNNKLSRYTLASGDTLSLVMLAQAAAKLKARNVPQLPNGLYAAIVDPLVLPQLVNDTAWQRATATDIESAKYFKDGIPLPLYGIEVITSNMVPYFTLPSGGTSGGAGVARHALVCGKDAFLKAPFQGLREAVRQVESAQRGLHIMRELPEDIFFVMRQPFDRLGDLMSMLWKFTGAFAAMTDVTSTPLIVPTSDYSRYKRCVEVEVWNQS